ncbi:hypothetical protein Dsin_017157 [Dipteronia sinensis]|uniref:Endonuclease/exonuclease/phosphatase domain-containing protein n=1 Tax=Dipteronia sinensis TaxID=43782 RepID=A0AAE0E660_9ROSI|nr:hypothetical protein Dsin_017157 [Dipteronia sinensis]
MIGGYPMGSKDIYSSNGSDTGIEEMALSKAFIFKSIGNGSKRLITHVLGQGHWAQMTERGSGARGNEKSGIISRRWKRLARVGTKVESSKEGGTEGVSEVVGDGGLVIIGRPNAIRTLAWNARGLGSPRATRVLQQLKRDLDPDVVFLMETKGGVSLMESLRIKLGFVGKLVVNAVGRSGGLCLFWSGKVHVKLLSFLRFHIDVKVLSHVNKDWRLTGFYGNLETDRRHHGWSLLKRLCGLSQLPWICIRNFNEILCDDEKVGGLRRNRRLMEEFRETLDWCELSDMGYIGLDFTWGNRRNGSEMIQERLDRGVCSFSWQQIFPNSLVRHLD